MISENHSTDRTRQILYERYNGIEVISPKVHLSGEEHINFCLDYAVSTSTFDYLAVYHGDDIYMPDIIKLEMAYLVRAEELFKPSIHAGLEAFYGVNNCKFLR